MKRRNVNSTAKHIFKLFGHKGAPLRTLIAVFTCGVSLGVAYEEMVGIGTWHKYKIQTDQFNVCFTPPSGCIDLIAQQIAKAQVSIYMQAYGLTSKAVLYQLKQAKERGVKVRILLDGGNLSDNKPVLEELKAAGIDVSFDKMAGIAHNKVIIIDKQKVITGSFNFTNAADTKNAENVVLIADTHIAAKYLDNWYKRKRQNIAN